jgi:predicted ATPase
MHIEQLSLKNFRAFRDVEMRNIPRFAIIIGANGSGKSTLFTVFAFLRDAMATNINTALSKLGGSNGFSEVRSRNSTGPIEIEVKFREANNSPLVTYSISIDQDPKSHRAYVAKEILQYRRGSKGQPWRFLNFTRGEGEAVTNEVASVSDESQLQRDHQKLISDDILAIKGLAQFQKFPAAVALGNLIERWHISDFHISRARPEQEMGYAEHLSREGENLALVIEYLHNTHPEVFNQIILKLKQRVPGISEIQSKQTEEGRILLKFQDGSFEDPFLARYVSDGTIKMLAYLVLLYDPVPHPLLCIEEPENQLYPTLLEELAEEFRLYARQGGQVFVSSHSPDLLNAAKLEEVFWLKKTDGYTSIHRASDDEQITAYMKNGDQMGFLWKQGFFTGADPR